MLPLHQTISATETYEHINTTSETGKVGIPYLPHTVIIEAMVSNRADDRPHIHAVLEVCLAPLPFLVALTPQLSRIALGQGPGYGLRHGFGLGLGLG